MRSRFHVWLGLWMLAIVVIGFWPTYFAPTLRGTSAIPTIVHAHGLVFLGWMTLLMAQGIVATNGTIRLHRRIGRWGIAYGCLVIAMGLIVGPASAVIKVNSGVWTRDRAAACRPHSPQWVLKMLPPPRGDPSAQQRNRRVRRG